MALPVVAVTKPALLAGQQNGRLPDSILVDIEGPGPVVRLVKPAALAFEAMRASGAKAGHVLETTSLVDSYRPYEVQEKIFRQRYTTTRLPGRPSRQWLGKTWWQKPGTAAAAVPGTSNHGNGLAVDLKDPPVAWLVAHAHEFGFSAELQSEPWHWRYFAGDRLPDAVAAYHGPTTPPKEAHKVLYIIRADGSVDHYVTDMITKRHLVDPDDLAKQQFLASLNPGLYHDGGKVLVWPAKNVDAIPVAG